VAHSNPKTSSVHDQTMAKLALVPTPKAPVPPPLVAPPPVVKAAQVASEQKKARTKVAVAITVADDGPQVGAAFVFPWVV
jgi:hypothetical protein